MNQKKAGRVVAVQEHGPRNFTLTFDRPHGILRAGQVVQIAGKPHTVKAVANKNTVRLVRWSRWRLYALRLQLAWRLVVGEPKEKKERAAA